MPIATWPSRWACSPSVRMFDTCDDRLLATEALLEVKKEVAGYIDLQLVAFPQDGFYRAATARRKHHPPRSTWASKGWWAASLISSAQ